MASTLAGNFTVIGSIANLIVIQGAAAQGGHWLLGLFQGRCAVDVADADSRNLVAVAVADHPELPAEAEPGLVSTLLRSTR